MPVPRSDGDTLTVNWFGAGSHNFVESGAAESAQRLPLCRAPDSDRRYRAFLTNSIAAHVTKTGCLRTVLMHIASQPPKPTDGAVLSRAVNNICNFTSSTVRAAAQSAPYTFVWPVLDGFNVSACLCSHCL